MNTEISNSCQCFGLYDNNNIIGFCGVLHYPHPITTNLKKISRLVILPDYQGIGLGTKFLNVVAKYWSNKGFNVGITTSAKNMIFALKKSDKWICTAQHSTAQHSRQKQSILRFK